MEAEEIKICENHDLEVPLIWTFKFPGAEYWCPACGYTCGMFGAGVNVPVTEELKKSAIEWKENATPFLSGDTETWEYIEQ